MSPLDEQCKQLESLTDDLAEMVWAMLDHPAIYARPLTPTAPDQVRANITLAYRHLEDASLRLARARQAAQ